MDPNATLGELLAIARGIVDADPDTLDVNDLREVAGHGCALAENICNLDAWLLKGGFLPHRWSPKP
jgi:hypothetical protein